MQHAKFFIARMTTHKECSEASDSIWLLFWAHEELGVVESLLKAYEEGLGVLVFGGKESGEGQIWVRLGMA